MKRLFFLAVLFSFLGCTDFGNLELKADLPKLLKEVSGIQYDKNEDAFWMLNDSNNASSIYLVSETGKIIREVKMNAENTDWEDITQDAGGNVYVGDFGNNGNIRTDLVILKIAAADLKNTEKVVPEKIQFYYPEQKKFPPKKKYYDTEGFFEWNGFFYIFTKSRVKGKIGRTFLYKVPNQPGKHAAERISDFTTCPGQGCWITGADISKDGKKVVLLNHTAAWVFSNFKGDDFFSGDAKEFPFGHDSQKESITFKNSTTIYIADEGESGHGGRNLYKLNILFE